MANPPKIPNDYPRLAIKRQANREEREVNPGHAHPMHVISRELAADLAAGKQPLVYLAADYACHM